MLSSRVVRKTRSGLRNALAYLHYSTAPDFMIIGVQKGGTTSLDAMLRQHPRIKGSIVKEVHYFDQDELYAKGRKWMYHRYFPLPFRTDEKSLIFESTPIYFYHPDVPARLHKYNPDLKLILVVRNPAYRALSAWNFYHKHFSPEEFPEIHEPRSFSEVLEQEMKRLQDGSYHTDKKGYVKRGLYADQLQKYLEYFPMDRLHILESKEIKTADRKVFEGLFGFLDLDYEDINLRNENVGKKKTTEKYRKEIDMLHEFYQAPNQRFFELIGKEYHWDHDEE